MSIPNDRFTESLVETADWYKAIYLAPPSEDQISHTEYVAKLLNNYPDAAPRAYSTTPAPSSQSLPSTLHPPSSNPTSSTLTAAFAPPPAPALTAPTSSFLHSTTHHAPSTDLIAQRMADDSTTAPPPSLPTFKLSRVIKGHEGWVTSLDVDIGNTLFATCSNDNTVKVWNLESGTLLFTFTGHLLPVNGVKFSHLHPRLFSASNDRDCKMWDLETNTFLHNLHGHRKAVNCVQIHPTLDLVATGSSDTTIKVWDIRTKKPVRTLEGHRREVTSVVCLPTDPQIISSSLDASIRLWDLGTGKTISTHDHHAKSVRKLATHPTEYTLISASSDSIKKWRLPVVSNITHPQTAQWEAEQRQLIAALPPAQQKSTQLKPCQEPIHAATLTFLGPFQRGLSSPSGGPPAVSSLALNQHNVLVSARLDGIIDCYDYSTLQCYDSIQTPPIHGSLASEGMICDTAFDATGQTLLTACADKTIKMYSAQHR